MIRGSDWCCKTLSAPLDILNVIS